MRPNLLRLPPFQSPLQQELTRVEFTEIHGEDGLGGVEGLPPADDPRIVKKLAATEGQSAVLAIANCARSLPADQKLTIVATGSFTNVALFISMFPQLLADKVEQIVVMGGAEGRGNRSPTGERATRLLDLPLARC